jgi:lipid A disaccharide synthetase
MIVLYRTSALGSFFFRNFSVTPWIALPNILGAGVNDGEATVYEELFTKEPSPGAAGLAAQLLVEGEARSAALERLERLRKLLLVPGGIERAADAVLEFLDERRK